MAIVTATDFLVATGTPGLWVRLRNNVSGTDYYSTAVSDPQGSFTYSVPAGDYSLYTGAVQSVVGTPNLRSAHYQVALRNGDDGALNSLTALSSSPYVSTAVPGGEDFSAAVRIAGGRPWYDPTHPSFAGGADPTGVADSSPAVQACSTAAGRSLLIFVPGTFKYLSQVTIASQGQMLMGMAMGASIMRPGAAFNAVFLITATGVRVCNMLFQPTATQQVATTLAAQLTALTTYTAMTVATVPAGGWANGAIIRVGGVGGGTSQYATINQVGGYAAGGTNVVVNINSFKAYYTYAIGAAVQDERFSTSAFATDAIRLSVTANCVFDSLFFYYMNGWCINHLTAPVSFTTITNSYAQHCANGIYLQGSSLLANVGMDTMEVGEAFYFDSANDVQATNIWGGGYSYGVRMKNNVAACYGEGWDFGGLEGYSAPQLLIENPAAGGVNAKPRSIGITNAIFQNGTTGCTITDCIGVSFNNVDFFQNGGHGVSITGGDLINFTDCDWTQNNQSQVAAQADLNVTSTTARVVVSSPKFQSGLCASNMILPTPNLVAVINPINNTGLSLYGANAPQGTIRFASGQVSIDGGWRVPNNVTMQSNLAAGGAFNVMYIDGTNKLKFGTVDGAAGTVVGLFANAVEYITLDGANNVIMLKALRRSRQTPTEAVLVSGVDATAGELVGVTITAARLVGAPLNPAIGQRLIFTFIQGGAGAFAITWNAVFKKTWSDAGNVTGARSSIEYQYDGTNWNQTSAQAAYV